MCPSSPFEEKTFLERRPIPTGTTSGKPSPFFQYHARPLSKSAAVGALRCSRGIQARRPDRNLIPLSGRADRADFLIVGERETFSVSPVVSANDWGEAPGISRFVVRSMKLSIGLVAADPTVFWGIRASCGIFFRRARSASGNSAARDGAGRRGAHEYGVRSDLWTTCVRFGAEDPQVRVRYSVPRCRADSPNGCNEALAQNLTPDLYFSIVDPETGKNGFRRVPKAQWR